MTAYVKAHGYACGVDGSIHTPWDSLPEADPIKDLQEPGWREREAKRVGRVERSGSQIVTNKAVNPFRYDGLKHLIHGEFDV